MTSRRKLFSSTPVRRKLFSDNLKKEVMCMDCGHVIITDSSTTLLYCPKCGGKRFNVISNMTSKEVKSEQPRTRRSLFEASDIEKDKEEFSNPSNELEEKLKTYSGKEYSEEGINKLFSSTGLTTKDLVQKGFAYITDNDKVKIHDTAFIQSKLFSKLVISVTKVLDLDPINDGPSKEGVINSIIEKKCLEPKSVMLIKKAHGICPIVKESEFSETQEWIKDSGIQNDLHLEFGGSELELDKFKDILSERYDDAPEDIIDKLSENGIINIQGKVVEIL